MAAARPDDYLADLPDDRREAVSAVRDTINANLPDGFEEQMQYGMISWVIPLERYPVTYNGEPLAIASLASQKNHMALYLNCEYASRAISASAGRPPARNSTWARAVCASVRSIPCRSTWWGRRSRG